MSRIFFRRDSNVEYRGFGAVARVDIDRQTNWDKEAYEYRFSVPHKEFAVDGTLWTFSAWIGKNK
jgi:hypothetical protein